MTDLLAALENTALGTYVREAPLAYPVLLTFHAMGLALLAGILIVVDLRILGVGRGVPLAPLRTLTGLIWIGFWANAVSGTLLFTSDAVKFYQSPNFRVKMLCIVAGLILTTRINKAALNTGYDERLAAGQASRGVKLLAVLSLLCWLTAIVSGRLMAYLT
jgi:hypothetical protein